MSVSELEPFASVGVAVGVPVDPPETSVAPAPGEAFEGVDAPVGEPRPDVSVGVPDAAGVALRSAVGDPAPESGIEEKGGELDREHQSRVKNEPSSFGGAVLPED